MSDNQGEEGYKPSEGATDPNWFNDLPEPLRQAPYFRPKDDGTPRDIQQVVADLEGAAKLQGNLSESHIRIPPPDAAETDIGSFRERVLKADPGLVLKPDDYAPVPENAGDYKAPEIDGFSIEGEALGALQERALQSRWSQKQFESAVQYLASDSAAAKESQANWARQQGEALTEKLGSAKDDHLARTAAALREASPEVADAITAGKLDASVVLALDTLVHQMIDMGGETATFHQDAGKGARVPTKDEARNRAEEIRQQMTDGSILPGSRRYNELQQQLLDYTQLSMG